VPTDSTFAAWITAGATTPAMSRPEPVSEAADDAALVEAALGGDTTAFDHLVTRHRRAVYQVCYRFVHHHDDAADLTQDTFLRAWKALGSFRKQARFSTWLYRIAVNVSLNKVGSRAPRVEAVDFDLVADPHQAPPTASLERDHARASVRRAVRSLPPRQRTALILRTYHELSHQEVAEIVGTSVGAVKANVFHALANLRRRLESLR
jgi:RNA polymerase sigma-70 factor (ECF subfamily)